MTQIPCIVCNGRGYHNCAACGGRGATYISKTRQRYDRTLEFYQDRRPCGACDSSGRNPCVACRGAGWILQPQMLISG